MVANLWEMLRQRVSRIGPPWGSFGFPYRCGVTPEQFETWAASPVDGANRDISIHSMTVGGVLWEFCDDCAFRKRAIAEGTCIRPVLGYFRDTANSTWAPSTVAAMVKRDRLTAEQAAARLNISQRSVWRAISRAREQSASRAI